MHGRSLTWPLKRLTDDSPTPALIRGGGGATGGGGNDSTTPALIIGGGGATDGGNISLGTRLASWKNIDFYVLYVKYLKFSI
jgi:hypothetical protein